MEEKWHNNGVKFFVVVGGIIFILVFSVVICVGLPDYLVKMRALEVIEKAVDKGIELRLNGDLFRGVELVKKVSK